MSTSLPTDGGVVYGGSQLAGITALPQTARPRMKGAPLEANERRALNEQHQQKTHDIVNAMEEWSTDIHAKAAALGECFDKPPKYFIERLFNNPSQVYLKRKTNLFNAWAWRLAQEKTTCA